MNERAFSERAGLIAQAIREHKSIGNAYLSLLAEKERLREALEAIERMAGAAGYGEIPAKPIAERARAALCSDHTGTEFLDHAG